MKAIKMYLGIALCCIMCGYYTISTHNNYIEVCEVNDELIATIDEQRESYERLLKSWENSYLDLQGDYADLLYENHQLREVELPVYTYTFGEVEVLAKCVQCEAGYSTEAQIYVTQVIMNRVQSPDYPDNIVDVIYQKCNGVPQFSVAYDGKMDRCEVAAETLVNVQSVLMYGCDLPEDVMFFYSEKLAEDTWIKSLKVYDTIDGTVFCHNKKGD